MMLRVLCLAAICALALATTGARAADGEIGRVSRLQGAAQLQRGGEWRPLRLLSPLRQGDGVATGPEARLEIVFEDGTLLTLGAEAQVQLDEFVYSPGSLGNSLALSVFGAFRYVSGDVADGTQRRAQIRTRLAILGIRGTDFWGGPVDGRFGVLLFKGRVEVSTAAGSVVLDQPGVGTNIDAPGAAPGPVTHWPQAKVDRAIATVTFR
jgi:hypothetical protein